MDDGTIEVIANIIIGITLLAIVFLVSGVQSCTNYKDWNNGHCPCGGNWVYEQAVGHYADTGYLYHCDNCDNYIELSERYK